MRLILRDFEKIVCAALFLGMTALGFTNVVVRYGTHLSFAATEELMTNGFLLLTVFGAAIAARRGEHLAVTLLVDVLPRRAGQAVVALSVVLGAGLLAASAWFSWQALVNLWGNGMRSYALGIPAWYYQAALPFGFALVIVRYLQHAAEAIRAPRAGREPSRMSDLLGMAPGGQMIAAFFVLMALRVPVAFALGLSAMYAMWLIGFGFELAGDLIATGIGKYALLAIPFFILAGTLMGSLGIAERMIRFFRVLVGGLPGGMGVVGTVVCLFWGAVSGSGPASVAAIGPMIVKGMEEDGYPRAAAAALVCAGAALSIVIPPSIGLVIYGVLAETSISALFLAAILPGLFMGVAMLFVLPFLKPARPGPGALAALDPATAPEPGGAYAPRLGRAFRESFWGLMTPVVILGGIYSGIFTPTEAALVATVYALAVGAFAYRTLTWATLYDALTDAAASSAVVMLVVAYASLFGWVVTVEDLVGQYSASLLGLSDDEWVILLVIMVILLIAGMFMDPVTVMFISLPILLPVVRELGWDPVWFGVLVMVNLAIGLITPPVGINLYVAANVTRLPLERIARASLPFLVASLAGLAVIAAIPSMSTILAEILR